MKVIISTTPQGSGFKDMVTKTIDWTNSSDRKWLMNHIHWAMNNSHSVHLAPRDIH